MNNQSFRYFVFFFIPNTNVKALILYGTFLDFKGDLNWAIQQQVCITKKKKGQRFIEQLSDAVIGLLLQTFTLNMAKTLS